MEDSVIEVGEGEEIQNITSSNVKPRVRKKGTLTKLKERKQKEFGSTSSLRNDKSKIVAQNSHEESQLNADPFLNCDAQMTDLNAFSSSTIDATEDSDISNKPRPRPRLRRQSSEVTAIHLNSQHSSDIESIGHEAGILKRHDSSDGATIQMLKNLKMGSDKEESFESAITHSGFIPKPPSTPRTPRSNPRTPRGFVLGKGEKRIREPWSSGDEHEIEEKKEKINRIGHLPKQKDTMEIEDVSVSHGMQEQSTNAEKMRHNWNRPAVSSIKIKPQLLVKHADLGIPSGHSFIHGGHGNINSNNGNDVSAVNKDDCYTHDSLQDECEKSNNSFDSESQAVNFDQKAGNGVSSEKSSPIKNAVLESADNVDDDEGHSSDHEKAVDILHNNYHLLGSEIENGSHFTQESNTAESSIKMNQLSSPPATPRLKPISPKSHPPPLPEELSSKSLRTIYKIDPDVYSRTVMNKPATGTSSNGDYLSQKSYTSASVLPVITTKEARLRCCLDGSLSYGSSIPMGTCELDRYFPERKVNVFVGTWNMNELKDVTCLLDDFILPEKCDYVQDIYAIGTQENNINKKEWEIKLQETLGPSHVLFHSVSLGSLHLAVYIRRDLIWFCSVPEDDAISLRAVTMVKTKGAIGVCFTLFGTSFLFINCHLTSDRSNETTRKKNRLEDYYKVISEMKLPRLTENLSTSEKPTDVTSVFDCIFWFGDLNFRIERKRLAVERRVNQITSEEFPSFETLLGGDQLLNYMAEGKIFGGFQEGRINFHPTFKYDLDSNTYDTSTKNRVPSYTDRIMFRCKRKRDITCVLYDAVMSIKVSDHRPVYGQYEAALKPGRENMVYSVGHFDRSVYVEANRRRTARLPVKKKQSVVCAIQ